MSSIHSTGTAVPQTPGIQGPIVADGTKFDRWLFDRWQELLSWSLSMCRAPPNSAPIGPEVCPEGAPRARDIAHLADRVWWGKVAILQLTLSSPRTPA